MGTKETLERTLPVSPEKRQELCEDLDWFVFTRDKFQSKIIKPNV